MIRYEITPNDLRAQIDALLPAKRRSKSWLQKAKNANDALLLAPSYTPSHAENLGPGCSGTSSRWTSRRAHTARDPCAGSRPPPRPTRSHGSSPSMASARGRRPRTELRTVSSVSHSPRPELLHQGVQNAALSADLHPRCVSTPRNDHERPPRGLHSSPDRRSSASATRSGWASG